MATFFITGAGRGIGHLLAQKALSDGHKVYCACRHPDGARALWEMEADHKQCKIVTLDVADKAPLSAESWMDKDEPLDYLINNAGVLDEFDLGLEALNFDLVEQAFRVNALGPMRVTRALLPWLRLSQNPVIAHMSSRVGSLADNTSGRGYGYRMSKAALNMFNVSLALEQRSMTSIVLHPGWVKTKMGGAGANLEVWDAVEGLFKVLMSLKPEDSGRFLDYQGQEIPW